MAKTLKTNWSSEDRALNDALEQTFPASDPVSGNEAADPTKVRADRQPASINRKLVEKLSRDIKKRLSQTRH